MLPGLFITGTGTGVGKTYVAALIARALRTAGKKIGVYKPVASGCEVRDGALISPDAMTLWEAAGRPGTLEHVCPQRFAAPLAPHLAARKEGRRVDRALLRDGLAYWRDSCEIVLVEGAGGLLSPISDTDYNADLAADFGYPLVVVAVNELGTINATLQTLVTARTYRSANVQGVLLNVPGTQSHGNVTLHVAGIVLNSPNSNTSDPSVHSNADELITRSGAPLLAIVEHGAALDQKVDWLALAATR